MRGGQLEVNAKRYAEARSLTVDFHNPLGHGTDGSVWKTSAKSAIKVLARWKNYLAERGCYQRLRERGVTQIQGLAVPRLIDFDDAPQVVEMDIVAPPYLLDFGKAYLDEPSPHTPEAVEEWRAMLAELFEADTPRVLRILRTLKRYGIDYADARPANIRLRAEDDA